MTGLDRLGRDTPDVLNLIHECEAKGSLRHSAGTARFDGRRHVHIVLTMVGMLAQMETPIHQERRATC